MKNVKRIFLFLVEKRSTRVHDRKRRYDVSSHCKWSSIYTLHNFQGIKNIFLSTY